MIIRKISWKLEIENYRFLVVCLLSIAFLLLFLLLLSSDNDYLDPIERMVKNVG